MAYSQSPNPAAVYAEQMGLKVHKWKDHKGNEYGMVQFADGVYSSEWDFYRGATGKKHSYCTKKGYEVISDTIRHKGWTEVKAVCVKGKTKSGDYGIKIDMLELMEKNGDAPKQQFK